MSDGENENLPQIAVITILALQQHCHITQLDMRRPDQGNKNASSI